MQESAAKLKALGDPTRLRVAVLLAAHGDICVCNLAESLGEAEFKISRHLAVMRASGLVEVRRKGVWKYYRLAQANSSFDAAMLRLLRACPKDHPALRADLARLNDLRQGEGDFKGAGHRRSSRSAPATRRKNAKAE
ncbi:MAG: ArsR/SmtB family transcription factor [Thermogutta sp.]